MDYRFALKCWARPSDSDAKINVFVGLKSSLKV